MSLISYMSTAKSGCKAGYTAVPQFTFVPYEIDNITLGMRGPLVVLTIWAILNCGRFTVRVIVTGRLC